MKNQENIRKSVIFGMIMLSLFVMARTASATEGADLIMPTPTTTTDESAVIIPTGSGSNDEEIIVVGGGSNGEEGENIIPNATSSNGVEGDDLIPTGIGSNGDEGEDLIPTGDGSNDDELATTTPPVATTTPPVVNPPVNHSYGSSGGRSIFVVPVIATTTPVITATSCDYLSSYLKFGANNDSAQVTKLQNFLKDSEKLNVDVSGIFDVKTMNAVKAFQLKYASEILTPWGMTTPSGYVYYTTQKKVNEIYCKTTFNLTPAQLSDIFAYRNANQENNNSVIKKDDTGSNVVPNTPNSTSTNEEFGSANNESQAAAVVNSGSTSKISKFFKWLFGY